MIPEALTFAIDEQHFTIEAAAGSTPTFKMVPAYSGGLMKPKGFEFPVVVELSGISFEQSVPVRYNHDVNAGVGHTSRVAVENGALVAEGVVSRKTLAAEDVVHAGKNGYPWRASVGLVKLQCTKIADGLVIEANGRQFTGPLIHVTSASLQELSFVERGADEATAVRIAASANSTETPPTGASMKPEDTPTPADTVSTTPAVIQAARAEETRVTELEAIAGRALEAGADLDQVEQLLASATKDKTVTSQSFERQVILARRPASTNRRGAPSLDGKVIEAALCIAGGLENLEKRFDERTLNAAADNFHNGLSLTEGIHLFAKRNGFDGSLRDVRPLLQAAFADSDLRASGFSTMSLPGILSNVANKFLLEGFNGVESAWDRISAKRNVRDFKTVTSHRLTGGFEFEKVPAAGEIPHGTIGEEAYTNKVDTYGRMFAITRQDVINDDLSALTAVPRRIGRGGAVKLNQVFWSVFQSDGSFFTTGNANLVTGTANVLGVTGLGAAELAFRTLKDSDGNPLGMKPSILLVPAALRILGSQLMTSVELRGMSAKEPTGNPFAGLYELVDTSYLTSATGYYLLASPNELPVVEVAFLNGQRSPTVESAEANFNTLGVEFRGYHDWGVSLVDPRGGVKATGVAA